MPNLRPTLRHSYIHAFPQIEMGTIVGRLDEQLSDSDQELLILYREAAIKALTDYLREPDEEPETSIPDPEPDADAAKYEQVFGVPKAQDIPVPQPDSRPTRAEARAVLETAGYDGGPRGFAQWGITAWEDLPVEVRNSKLEIIRNTAAAPAAPARQNGAQSQISQLSIENCPNVQLHGAGFEAWSNRAADGKVWYKCKDSECRRPGGQNTTWDERNFPQRIQEFETGKAYIPKPRSFGSYRPR